MREPLRDKERLEHMLEEFDIKHDENVIRSNTSNTIFVVDCDIRINTPELQQGGIRTLTTSVMFRD
jgi:hypothetical protein